MNLSLYRLMLAFALCVLFHTVDAVCACLRLSRPVALFVSHTRARSLSLRRIIPRWS